MYVMCIGLYHVLCYPDLIILPMLGSNVTHVRLKYCINAHLHLLPRLRMSGATPPRPLYALTAWAQITLPLPCVVFSGGCLWVKVGVWGVLLFISVDWNRRLDCFVWSFCRECGGGRSITSGCTCRKLVGVASEKIVSVVSVQRIAQLASSSLLLAPKEGCGFPARGTRLQCDQYGGNVSVAV